jgi:hypothetical protein
MSRPESVTNEDLLRWSEKIESDPMGDAIMQSAIVKEVCFAGFWLSERLKELKCNETLIGRIIYTAGRICFGREPWEVHQNILTEYVDGTLIYEKNLEEN